MRNRSDFFITFCALAVICCSFAMAAEKQTIKTPKRKTASSYYCRSVAENGTLTTGAIDAEFREEPQSCDDAEMLVQAVQCYFTTPDRDNYKKLSKRGQAAVLKLQEYTLKIKAVKCSPPVAFDYPQTIQGLLDTIRLDLKNE